MSKYKERGPYHFVEYCNRNTPYHAHVEDFTEQLAKILNRKPHMMHIHEVGCGEGLILHVLSKKLEYFSERTGNDIDETAVDMGNLIGFPSKIFFDTDITKSKDTYLYPEVVIFSDSLEHIANWKAHIDWAKKYAKVIAMAWPSAIDKNAIQQFSEPFFDQYFPQPWKCEYRKTRDYRHVTIWTRP